MSKYDEVTKARLKQAYLAASEPTKQAIVDRLSQEFGISVPQIRRYVKAEGWDAIREGKQQVIRAAVKAEVVPVAEKVNINGVAIDCDELIVNAINSLSADVAALPGKTRESAATAMLKAIELYRKYHPMTIDEAIDLVISLPGFEPQDFARRLRERFLNRQAG